MLIEWPGFGETIEHVGQVMDAAGVAVTVAGVAVAVVLYARRSTEPGADPYVSLRRRLARSILLGLEFLVAADIIRTVAVRPSFRGVGILAVIVAVRSFLSWELEREIEGRLPWQRRTADQPPRE